MAQKGLPMRLSFPNGEHPDVVIDQGDVRVGSAAGNRVVVSDAGLSAHHAVFRIDAQRGISLLLEAGSGGAHVNARPVRELALLRLGDVVSLNRLQVLVKPDDERHIDRNVPAPPAAMNDPAQRAAASRVVLRGIAGAFHGRTFSLLDPLTIGRAANADIRLEEPGMAERHAVLEQHSDRVVLRDLGSHDGCVVNGVALKSAVLHPGDQIAFEQHRFVLEAPGLPPRGTAAFAPVPRAGIGTTQTLQAVKAPLAEATPQRAPAPPASGTAPSGRFNYWWLLGAAAVIAIVLVGILIYAPR
jgi:pSer/pThr/pTyr-binding forkhead associated (FHA) protein